MVTIDESFLISLQDKHQAVTSSVRLLSEASASLDRAIRDFDAFIPLLNEAMNASESSSTQAVDVASKKKKEKKERDPDMPKRPGSAFFLFQNKMRQIIKDSMPSETKANDVQRQVAEKWAAMSETEKKPYMDLYEQEVKDYEAKMNVYNTEHGIVPKTKAAPKSPRAKKSKVSDVSKAASPEAKVPENEDEGSDDNGIAAAALATNDSGVSSEDESSPAPVPAPKTPKETRKRKAIIEKKPEKTPVDTEKSAKKERKRKRKSQAGEA